MNRQEHDLGLVTAPLYLPRDLYLIGLDDAWWLPSPFANGQDRRRRFLRPVHAHHEKDRAVWRRQPVCFLVGRRGMLLNMDGQRAVGILLQAG